MNSLERFLEQLEIERNLSPHTLRAYASDLAQLFDYAARDGKDPEQVDHRFLRRYLAYLQTTRRSRKTIARKLSAARMFYRFLVARGIVESNPAALLSAPVSEKRLPKVLGQDAVSDLLGAPDTSTVLGTRDKAILEVLYAGGLRVSEVVGINLRDLDLGAGQVRVLGKGSKERVALVGAKATDALSAYLDGARDRLLGDESPDAIFLNRFGGRMSTNSVRSLLAKYVAATSARGAVTPHVLRHSFATHMLENGADLRTVQELLGHVDLSSTQIYTHLGTAHLKAIHSKSHPRA